MRPLICPACGCSLVRLGIAPKPGLAFDHPNGQYFFCCAGCRDLFLQEPERYMREIESVDVCPVCLAEKSTAQAVRIEYANRILNFCRCPHCLEQFHRQPSYYLHRMEGWAEPGAGVETYS